MTKVIYVRSLLPGDLIVHSMGVGLVISNVWANVYGGDGRITWIAPWTQKLIVERYFSDAKVNAQRIIRSKDAR